MFNGENSVGRMTIEVRILENVLQVSEMLKTEASLKNTRRTFLEFLNAATAVPQST